MPKKKIKPGLAVSSPRPPSSCRLIITVKRRIIADLDDMPEIQKLTEAEYCETVLAALDLVRMDLKMCLDELK